MFTASRCARVTGALLLLTLALPAQAVKQGDWLIRAGMGQVAPNDKSGEITGVANSRVGVDSGTSVAFNFTYMWTDNIGVELLASLPFKHDLKGEGTVSGLGKIAEVKHLPPTLLLVYNFSPKSEVRSYAGLGLNHTIFFGEKVTDALSGGGLADDISLDNSTGLALEAGIDVDINKDWFFNASIWRMDIDTKATLKGGALDGATVNVNIDPWALIIGVGKRF